MITEPATRGVEAGALGETGEHDRCGRGGMDRMLGAALGFSMGFAALAYAFHGLDLWFSEFLRAAAALSLLALPSGFLLTRGLGSVIPSPVERLGVAFLVGYPVSAGTYFLLCVLGIPTLFPFLVIAAALRALIVGTRGLARLSLWGSAEDWLRRALLFLLLALIPLVTLSANRAYVPAPGGLLYRGGADDLIHMSLYWELLRGIPPRELPAAAGVPFPKYHILPYIPGVLLVKYAGLGVVTVHHAVMPALHLCLLALGIHVGLRIRTRNPDVAGASLLGLFFVGPVVDSVLGRERSLLLFEAFVCSEATAAGMVLWVTILCLLGAYDEANRRGLSDFPRRSLLCLTGLLVGISCLFKAQFFVLFGSAYALGLAAAFIRRRAPELLGAATVTAVTVALLWWSWRTNSVLELTFKPGSFPREAGRLPALLLRSLPGLTGLVLATAWGVWRVLHLSPLVPLYVLDTLRSSRSTRLADAVVCLTLLLSVVLGCGFAVRWAHGRIDDARQAFYPLRLLAFVVDAALLGHLLERRGREGGRIVLAGSLALAGVLLPVLLLAPKHRGAPETVLLGPGEQGALIYLREKTPLDAVVASRRLALAGRNVFSLVAGLGGRRAMFEYYRSSIDPENDREADLRMLFSSDDAENVDAILRRYKVQYVLEFPSQPLKIATHSLLLLYDGGDARIYRVPWAAGSEVRSGPLYTPGGLR